MRPKLSVSKQESIAVELKTKSPSRKLTFATATPGVAKASLPFRRFKQRVVLGVVVIPFLGAVATTLLITRIGITPVDIGVLVLMYMLSILGISVGFHRQLAHRAFQANTLTRAVLIILGSMAVQGPVLTWAATHRCHHQFSDLEGDPHSPYVFPDGNAIRSKLRGFWHSHIGWLFEGDIIAWGRYVPDLLRDELIFKLSRYYFLWVALGLAIPAAIGGLVSGTLIGAFSGFLWGGLARIFLVHHVSWTIGSVCHIYGRRPFDTGDLSTNNAWLSVFTVGDSWHNNHHAFPTSAWHGLQWWQIDLAGATIKILEVAGLAWDVQKPTAHAIQAKQKH